MQESYINARHGDDGNVPAFQNSASASPVAGESRLVTPMRQQIAINVHPAMRINSEEEQLRLKDEFGSPHGADPRPIDDSPALIPASPSGSNRTPITLTFKDLGYSVQLSKAHMAEDAPKNKVKVSNRREILKGLTGICRPGELTAIMGSSGAGKTTLLNILSVRTTTKGNNVLSGEFLANKQAYDFGKFNKFAGYVMQNDILLETMTPREIFQFVADLRLNISKEERVKKVNQLLTDLRLNRAADTFVGGGFLKGISGGERKRTSIGVELMTDPNLLFLDEPTSGLDSFTAFLLITLLKNLAVKNNKTVIFTIHQPSSDTFFLFDKLMLLAKGKFIYQGPTSHAVDYFKTIGYQCPEYTNPADYFIEVAHSNGNDDSKYEKMYTSYDAQLAPAIAQEVDNNPSGKIALAQKTVKPFEAFSYIAKRSFKHMLRNPLLVKGRFGQTIFVTFLICCVYFKISSTVNNDGQGNTGNQTAESIQSQIIRNTNGALFFFVISIFMQNAMTIILTFPAERAIFLREYSSNMYSVSAYYFGKSSVEIPFIIFFPVVMSAISYYIIGFNSGADNFFIFMLINVLVALAGNATGLWLGSLFNDPKVATNVLPAFLIPFMLFAGFYINVGSIHHWIRWVQWLSPFRYALEAMMWNQYQGSSYGTDQIHIYHYDLGLWQAIGTLFGLGLGIRLLALISLKLLVRKLE